ncbi:MAG: hypothetical protein WBG86_04230 [Polyangiales bacterium]
MSRMWTDRVITGALLVVAAIHLVPLTGFFGAARLEALYGISVSDANLAVLMRHRAVLFGILGAFFAYAAFVPAWQPAAFVAALVSIASFFYLAFVTEGAGDAIRKIVVGDIVAAVALFVAIGLYVTK